MTRMLFEEVDNARKILGFGITADLITIKKAYRKLVKDWHPDKCNKKDEELCHEKTKEINKAYKIILKYIENYSYSFAEEKVLEESPEERWKKQFGGDPHWGMGKGGYGYPV